MFDMPKTEPDFTITRTLNARRELVWKNKELGDWLPATPLETIFFDVREGGCYRYTMVNNETGKKYPTGGVFLDVVPFERLIFTCNQSLKTGCADSLVTPAISTYTTDGSKRSTRL